MALMARDPFVEFGAFPLTYYGGATLDGYAFTKK